VRLTSLVRVEDQVREGTQVRILLHQLSSPPMNKEEVQESTSAARPHLLLPLLAVSKDLDTEAGDQAIAHQTRSGRLTPAPLGHIVT
jgi:hypothetical protein